MHGAFIKYVGHPLLKRWSGEGGLYRYLREYQRSQFDTPEQIRQRQWTRLKALLEHAYRNCPFYRDRFNEAGLAPVEISSWEDFQRIPFVEKSDIQTQRDRMVATNISRNELIPNQTGGSTGSPLSFFVDRERMTSRSAATWRHDQMAGFQIGDKYVSLWGALQDRTPNTFRAKLRDLMLKRHRQLDTAQLTEEGMRAFAEMLQRFKPRIILAYAKALALFARFLKHHQLAVFQPHSIITSAEVLEPDDRQLIEEMFGCRVFNRYGCREFSVIASECEHHDGLHAMAEGLFVETIKDGRPAAEGELGSIVVTDLLNVGMPMIRYQIGDLGSMDWGVCRCGRGLPRLKNVAGRVTDFVVAADGRLISGVFLATYIVAQRPSLGQVQIHQERVGEIRYKIKPSSQFQQDEDVGYLRTATRKFLGEATKIETELVQQLDRLPSGKYRFSWSTVMPDFLKTTSGEASTDDGR